MVVDLRLRPERRGSSSSASEEERISISSFFSSWIEIDSCLTAGSGAGVDMVCVQLLR